MTIDKRTDAEKGLHQHDMDSQSNKKEFADKIYMFPPSYNALRKELTNHWPTLWQHVQWTMAFSAGLFIERMNDALDLYVQMDSHRVDAICTEYLQALQKKRSGPLASSNDKGILQ